jgi:hypothetical protein
MSSTGSKSSVVLLHGALLLAAGTTWGLLSDLIALCMVFAMSRRAMLLLRLTRCPGGGRRWGVPPSRGLRARAVCSCRA